MLLLLLTACFTDGPTDSGIDSGTDTPPLVMGLDHRATAVACAADRPVTEPADASCGTHGGDTCAAHDDCTDGLNGRCVLDPNFFDCACRYDECTLDEDCGGTAVCGCAETAPHVYLSNNRCMNGDCREDADCPSGLCLANRWGCGSVEDASSLNAWGYFCATDADTCRSDDVCTDWGDFCVFGQDDTWSCSQSYSMTCE